MEGFSAVDGGYLTLPISIPEEEKKLIQIFILTLLCDASKGFIKTLKAFIKPFEAPQRRAKIKIWINLYLIQLSEVNGAG